MRMKHNITPLLELESGANDPVAIFLTLGITQLIVKPETSVAGLLGHLLLEMPLGLGIGMLAGWGAVAIINRIRLEYDGLYPAITIATVCFSFGAAHLIGGNPFLSVYVAGVTMGSRTFLHRLTLIQFHDAMAWLTQIVMFVVLGLLVFPKQLPSIAGPGLALSLFLILVARPLAVFISLALTKMQKRTKFFISWAGLRGAVPIILATFPAIAGVPEAPKIFNLVFFIVATSVLIQGTTLKALAKKLSVTVTQKTSFQDLPQATSADLLEIRLEPDSRAIGKQVVELGLPSTALIVLLKRGPNSHIPRGSTVLQGGDILVIASRLQDHNELERRF
jgi:cell volume regulation protein A